MNTGTETLTSSQERALETLIAGDENVFLTGKAGSGKSFLLKRYLREAGARGIRVACLAPTGIAAVPLGGQTVHRFFGLKAPVNEDHALRNLLRGRHDLREKLRTTDVIVIDEVSMLHGWLLKAIEEGTRRVLEDARPWGGKRVVLVGDFLQLPPVASWRERSAPWQWAFHSSAWGASRLRVRILSETMRQSEERFLDALNEARVGQTGEKLADLLRERSRSAASGAMTHLFATNDETDSHNQRKFEELSSRPVRTFVTDYRFASDPGAEKVGEDEFPIPRVLHVRPGAEVVFRQNDSANRWVNGTRGRVVGFSSRAGDELVTVEVEDGRTYDVGKTEFKICDHQNHVLARAFNYPFHLAWALTIHKSQGMSLPSAYLDLSRVSAPGQAYVALSRVRSERGVFIGGARPDAFTSDPDALAFMNSLVTGEFAPTPEPRSVTGLEPGVCYSQAEIEDVLENRFTKEQFHRLIVTNAVGDALLVKGRADMNPRISEGELWVAAGGYRREQVDAARRLTEVIPLFAKVPGNNGREWRFVGNCELDEVIERADRFPPEVRKRGGIQAIVRLKKVDR